MKESENILDACIMSGGVTTERICCPHCEIVMKADVYWIPEMEYDHNLDLSSVKSVPVRIQICRNCNEIITEDNWNNIDRQNSFELTENEIMKQFFKDTWDVPMKILMSGLALMGIFFSLAWSHEDNDINIAPLLYSIVMACVTHVIAFVNWVLKKNREGGSHG